MVLAGPLAAGPASAAPDAPARQQAGGDATRDRPLRPAGRLHRRQRAAAGRPPRRRVGQPQGHRSRRPAGGRGPGRPGQHRPPPGHRPGRRDPDRRARLGLLRRLPPVGDWTPLDAETRGRSTSASPDWPTATPAWTPTSTTPSRGPARPWPSGRPPPPEGGEVCKAVLLFTDGNFALGARTTPEQVEEFGDTKPYAPDVVLDDDAAVREATAAGIAALCDPGGVADQVRTDRITVITVPLTENLDEGPRRLIEAITTGRGEERTCGDPETDLPGVYLPAADTDELLRTFDLVATRIAGGSLAADPVRLTPCLDEPCDEGTVDFSVAPSLRRVHLFATVPGDDGRLVLRPPEGDPVELRPGEDQALEVDGVPVRASWIAERALTVDLDLPDADVGAGTWKATLVAGAATRRRGRHPGRQLQRHRRRPHRREQPGPGRGVDPLGHAHRPRGRRRQPRRRRSPGHRPHPRPHHRRGVPGALRARRRPLHHHLHRCPRASPPPPSGCRCGWRRPRPSGARISSVAPEVDLPVRRPAGYPQLAPAPPGAEPGHRGRHGGGQLVLVPPEEDAGCAWLEDLEVTRCARRGLGLLGRGRRHRPGRGRCTSIAAPVDLVVGVEVGDRADGTVNGYVRLYLASGAGEEPIATDVPVTFEMSRGVDAAKRLVVAVALLLGGLLLPLAAAGRHQPADDPLPGPQPRPGGQGAGGRRPVRPGGPHRRDPTRPALHRRRLPPAR